MSWKKKAIICWALLLSTSAILALSPPEREEVVGNAVQDSSADRAPVTRGPAQGGIIRTGAMVSGPWGTGGRIGTNGHLGVSLTGQGRVPCSVPDSLVRIEIFTDNYPNETTWELVEENVGVVASGGPYANPLFLYTHEVGVCADRCYDFTIFDAFADGICCTYGNGYYNVLFNGNLVATGGEFGASETVENVTGHPDCVPPPSAECPTCPGDLDGDGLRTGGDIQGFADCLLASGGGPPSPGCGCADMDGDGLVGDADIPNFVADLLAGQSCPVTMTFATSAVVTILMTDPPLGIISLDLESVGPGDTAVRLDAPPYATGVDIPTEMVAMDLVGFHPLLGQVEMHESPDAGSVGVIGNVVASGGAFISGDSMLDVFITINLLDQGVTAFNPTPVTLQSMGNTQLPPDVPHTSGTTSVPLLFDSPGFEGEIIDVVHSVELVCIYDVICIDGPCNNCGVALGDLCISMTCPNLTCSTGFKRTCGDPTCCVEYSLVDCRLPAGEPPCPTGDFCPVCDPTPGACCLPDGSCVILTEAECKNLGGPNAYQGDGTTCDPLEKCCFADGSCIDTLAACCTLAGGTPFPGLCQPVEACCFPDGSCQDLEPDCCTLIGGVPDGPGLCIPPEKCCLPGGACIQADPLCCLNVLGGTPFPGLCQPVEACCFPDGSCLQLEPDCCIVEGGTPDGVGPCLAQEACCLNGAVCVMADPLCCINVLGGIPEGFGTDCDPNPCTECCVGPACAPNPVVAPTYTKVAAYTANCGGDFGLTETRRAGVTGVFTACCVGGTDWQIRVTSIDSDYAMDACDLGRTVVNTGMEASVTNATCQAVITDFTPVGGTPAAPYATYVNLTCVTIHEQAHVDEWKVSFDAAWTAEELLIEALTTVCVIPAVDTPAEAVATLMAAINLRLNNLFNVAVANWPDDCPCPPGTSAAYPNENACLAGVVTVIQGRGFANCPP